MVQIIASRDKSTGEVTVHHVLPREAFPTEDALHERIASLVEQVGFTLDEAQEMVIAAAPDVLAFTDAAPPPRPDGRRPFGDYRTS